MLLALSIAAAMQSGSLDAPVANKPTVRSEISRGYDASFNVCSTDPALLLHPHKMGECGSMVADANRDKNSTGFEPFSLGAYFQSWQTLNSQAAVGDLHDEAYRELSLLLPVVEQYVHDLGLTDQQLFEAVKASAQTQEAYEAARRSGSSGN